MRRILLAVAMSAVVVTLAACSAGSGSGLTGKAWKLTTATVTGSGPAMPGVVPVADQERYTITFNTDGTFSAKADCNQLAGAYTTSGSSITITPGPMTLAACPDDSFSDAYVAALGQVATYAVGNSVLTLTLKGGGTLVFG